MVPTATQVADAVNASPEASALLSAAAQGTGAGSVGEADYQNLDGGSEEGADYLKFLGSPNTLRLLCYKAVS